MLIDRTDNEDLSMLDLLVSKLEENMDSKGIGFFDADKDETSIDDIVDHDGESRRRGFLDDDYMGRNPNRMEPRPVKRIKLVFNSKADFSTRHVFDRHEITDDGIYTASFLHITWDYITGVFAIYTGVDTYEKDTSSKQNIQKKAYRSDSRCVHVSLDFGLKYRRDIQLIKVRLGKLYSKLVIDRKTGEERQARKDLTEAAIAAFPDLIDPLILGGSLNEKRNDRGILIEGRSSSEDSV
jgi:hypothetical protein